MKKAILLLAAVPLMSIAQPKEVKRNELEKIVHIESAKYVGYDVVARRYGNAKVEVIYKNVSDKAINGVKIVIDTRDIFDDRLTGTYFKDDKPLAPGESRTRLEKFGADQDKFKDKPVDKITAEAYPIQIITGDGQNLKDDSVNTL
ncbi:hypothetical protein [Advenella mimigardefordensis]|uniref:hypothetical protein n=1 Tax=Advenella mimigardefordensis TaxID=302406 RepID=UPI00046D5B15|nr:hypothetical protein [Advenella mimigardefordensis]